MQIKAEHIAVGCMAGTERIGSRVCVTNGHVKPISPRGISAQPKALAKRCRIRPETVYPHSFRHRYAKNFLARFNDISLLADLMGHESIETTRVYLTRLSQKQQAVIDRVVTR